MFESDSREPYVAKLREKFGVPADGMVILYKDIDKVLGMSRIIIRERGIKASNAQWYSIVSCWRWELKTQHNIIMKAVVNTGIEVLTPEKRIIYIGSHFNRGLNEIRNATEIAKNTVRVGLGKEDLATLDLYLFSGSKIKALADKLAERVKFKSRKK